MKRNIVKPPKPQKFSALRGYTMEDSNIIRTMLSVPPEARKITILLTISKNI